jgi:hypothetical protein
MSEPIDEFDLPKLGDALKAAYSQRAQVPASIDDAISAAARERFDQRRRLRMLVRRGGGVAAGIAAVIVIGVMLHRPAALQPLAQGGDHPLNMVDALNLAKHLAAKDAVDKSWDLNHDGVIDQKDVEAVAIASVDLKANHVVHRSLPKLRDLGIDRPAASALANVIPANAKTLANANPIGKEGPQ